MMVGTYWLPYLEGPERVPERQREGIDEVVKVLLHPAEPARVALER